MDKSLWMGGRPAETAEAGTRPHPAARQGPLFSGRQLRQGLGFT